MDFWKMMTQVGKGAGLLLQVLKLASTVQLMQQAHQLYEKGEYEKALEIAERASEQAHQWFAETAKQAGADADTVESFNALKLNANQLAALHYALGNYVEAAKLLRETLEIQQKILFELKKEPDLAYSQTLGVLATLYYSMGDYSKAEALLQEGLDIRQQFAEKHMPLFSKFLLSLDVETARIRTSLGMVYAFMGNFAKAEETLQQALTTYRALSMEQHRYFAVSLGNLSIVSCLKRDYAKAELLCKQALEVQNQTFGERHPDVAVNLNNLAWIYQSTGNYLMAEPLYRQSLDIQLANFGKYHPRYAEHLEGPATLYAAMGREQEALQMLDQAEKIHDQMIGQIFAISSENQRMSYIKALRISFSLFMSLILLHLSHSPEAVRAGLDLVLRRKAIGAEALAAQREAVLRGRYPLLAPKIQELTVLRMQIAQKTLDGPGPEGFAQHQKILANRNVLKERLEVELASQIPEMNLERKLRAADRQAVCDGLPEGSVLIEFVRINVFDLKAVPARNEPRLLPAQYLAFVLPMGEPDNVQMIPLGQADFIDRQVAAFRTTITRDLESKSGRHMEPGIPSQQGPSDDGLSLRTSVFDPLVTAFRDSKRLFLATDGDLTRLPFEVLPTDQGTHLIDHYQISYLSTGRDLLRFGYSSTLQPTAPLIAADPDFDLITDGEKTLTGDAGKERQSRDLKRSEFHFGRLPGTRTEGMRIAAQLGVSPLLDQAVLETVIKTRRSPRILHIATHGFFLPDQEEAPNEEQIGMGMFQGLGRSMSRLENPLLRSGLALAGANAWLGGHTLPAKAEDGLLTAEDLSGLDLLDTELVVLSACETGLGEIQAGEGVFGLRRALVLAGAKTLVMSLWKVPDEQTQELMEDFYHRVLAGLPCPEALREAQLSMKAKYHDPFYWGAFVCQGDPGPLANQQPLVFS